MHVTCMRRVLGEGVHWVPADEITDGPCAGGHWCSDSMYINKLADGSYQALLKHGSPSGAPPGGFVPYDIAAGNGRWIFVVCVLLIQHFLIHNCVHNCVFFWPLVGFYFSGPFVFFSFSCLVYRYVGHLLQCRQTAAMERSGRQRLWPSPLIGGIRLGSKLYHRFQPSKLQTRWLVGFQCSTLLAKQLTCSSAHLKMVVRLGGALNDVLQSSSRNLDTTVAVR